MPEDIENSAAAVEKIVSAEELQQNVNLETKYLQIILACDFLKTDLFSFFSKGVTKIVRCLTSLLSLNTFSKLIWLICTYY